MYLGRYQLGDMVPLRLWTRDSSGTPAEPDAPPMAHLIAESGGIATGLQLPVEDSNRITGYFHHQISLGGDFTEQRYTVQYVWAISSTVYSSTAEFEVIPGGAMTGHGIAAHFFRQAGDDFVLNQDDTGFLHRLRGPEVRNA